MTGVAAQRFDGRRADPCSLVIFGASGDLTRRLLMPTLYHLAAAGMLHEGLAVIGVAHSDLGDDGFRQRAQQGIDEFSGVEPQPETSAWLRERLHYFSGDFENPETYRKLAAKIGERGAARGGSANALFYLATPPGSFAPIIRRLGEAGLAKEESGWRRVIIEKPFGVDLASAQALNAAILGVFSEPQIYRIDHYLGKETVQNLLAFRFANPIFESLWNRDTVESVEITVAEDLGVEHRGAYYQEAGALRDMVQNHLTQLLTVVGMEVPTSFEASEVRAEKLKVLRSISPILSQDVIFGQYTAWDVAGQRIAGYLEEPGVSPDSTTETYVALKLEIHNWRWRGVPFYLRTGKRLPRKITQVAVTFRAAPIQVFRSLEPGSLNPNKLLITLQPSEGFSLCFSVKTPGRPFKFTDRALRFDYGQGFGGELPEAYETLLRDIMIGDQTLFVTADFTETAWRLYDPLLLDPRPVHFYTAGSWGPKEADALVERAGRTWQLGW